MDASARKGFSFGLTSSIITAMGLMVGLYSGTGSQLAVIGGIVSIAIADSLSDALGIHISEESEKKNTAKHVWKSTYTTFLTKLVSTSTFLVPILLLDLTSAIIAGAVWGILLLSILSYFIAKERRESAAMVIAEHVGIAIAVVVLTYFVGGWVASAFGT
ncbi:MAG: hypothetical protein ABIH83_01460 [Candidatus Micrarchaeota archaeon]